MTIGAQLIIGIVINTLAFGIMGFRKNTLGIPVPKWLDSEVLQIPVTIAYFGSFLIVLLAPGVSWILKIILSLLMQFVINHVLWGLITGGIAGIFFKDRGTTE